MPLVLTLFFLAAVSLASALSLPDRQAQAEVAVADAAATSLLAYRQGVIDFLNANPGFAERCRMGSSPFRVGLNA